MYRDTEFFKPFGFDRATFFITLILVSIGIIMVFSSSGIISSEKFGHPFHYLLHQLIGAGLGLSFILILMQINIPFYQIRFFIFGLLFLTLGLLVLCLVLPSTGATDRWIHILNFQIQPSELAKISMILFLAFFLERKKEKMNHPINLVIPFSVIFLISFLVLMEPDYSTAIVIVIISAIMLYLGGVKIKYFFFPGLFAIGLFALYLLNAPYRWNRIIAILSPEKDPLGLGFQVIQSKLAVGSGGILSLGIGESIQKLFFLPSAHTDYIYAIIGEELGFVGTMAVLILFTLLFWRGFLIAKKAPTPFCQLAAAGISMTIFFQALLNISVVLGLVPPTGLTLPMISYGGSSLMVTLFSLGLLLHISQRRINRWEKH